MGGKSSSYVDAIYKFDNAAFQWIKMGAPSKLSTRKGYLTAFATDKNLFPKTCPNPADAKKKPVGKEESNFVPGLYGGKTKKTKKRCWHESTVFGRTAELICTKL